MTAFDIASSPSEICCTKTTSRDRDGEERDALDGIEAAAARIDDPKMLSSDRDHLVLRPFLNHDAVVRKRLFEDRDDQVLNLERGTGDDIAVALPLHVLLGAEVRKGQLTASANRPDGDFERQILVKVGRVRHGRVGRRPHGGVSDLAR